MFVAQSLAEGGGKRDVASNVSTPEISSDFETPWYLRFFVRDQPGIVARLAQILAAHHLNIDSLLQKPGFEKTSLPFVITLEPCHDSRLRSGAGRNGGAGFFHPAVLVPAGTALGGLSGTKQAPDRCRSSAIDPEPVTD